MSNIEPQGGFVPAVQDGLNLLTDTAQKREGLNLRYIVAAIRSNLRLLGVIFLSVVVISVLITLLQTPRFTAKSSIQINNAPSRVLKSRDDADSAEEGSSQSDTDRFLKTQIDILKSQSLAERVADRLKLYSNPRFFASQGRSIPTGISQEEMHFRVTELLFKYLTVDLPRDSRIVTITYESTDPKMSADIANAYAAEFIESNLKRKFDSSGYARDFLSHQLIEVKDKLEQSERALNAYSRSAGLISNHSNNGGKDGNESAQATTSVTMSSLLQVNQAANDAKAKRIAAEARWQAINSGPLLSTTEVVANQAISQLLSQRALISTALEEDRSRHLDDYPTVKSKEQELAGINQQIQVVATNIRNSIRADYLASTEAEKQLNAQVDGLKSATLNEQDRGVQFGLLAREVDTNRELYEGLLQRYKELNASAGISISNVSIIDQADVPLHPSSPNAMKNIALGLIAGFVLAVVALAVKDQFDDSVRIPEDIESKLSLSLLGVIPVSGKSNPSEELADPKSGMAEAYNSMRGQLLYSTTDGLPHVMLITSAQPSEGKSTTSYATASAFARMGKRVVLFDADLRRPSLHRQINDDNAAGLSTLLTSQDSVASVCKSSPIETLSLITSGPIPPSPTELLSSLRMKEVIAEASKLFDVVIFDSPPILGLADAPTLAGLVQGVIFVVEANRNRHGALKQALRRLRSVRPVLLGAVLTKFDPLRSGGRYGSYYGYEYYQYQYRYQASEQE